MSNGIRLRRMRTNLKTCDRVRNTRNYIQYQVAYIDLIKAKAVLVNMDFNNTLILDLDNCCEFEII